MATEQHASTSINIKDDQISDTASLENYSKPTYECISHRTTNDVSSDNEETSNISDHKNCVNPIQNITTTSCLPSPRVQSVFDINDVVGGGGMQYADKKNIRNPINDDNESDFSAQTNVIVVKKGNYVYQALGYLLIVFA